MLSKFQENSEREFAPAYFNSTTKTVIGPKDNPDKSFQEVFNRIDNWISKGSGWVIESIDGEYVNVCIYSPLSGSSYIELLHKLRNSKKRFAQYKNDGNKCFLRCLIRHLNPLKTHLERKIKSDRQMVSDLDYGDIKFPVSKMEYGRIEQKNNICINVFCYENDLVYPVYLLDKKFKNCMDLWLITDENKSHYVYIKDFNRFM